MCVIPPSKLCVENISRVRTPVQEHNANSIKKMCIHQFKHFYIFHNSEKASYILANIWQQNTVYYASPLAREYCIV